MNINPVSLTLIALFLSAIGLLFKFASKIQSDLKEAIRREFLQDQEIKNCTHQIELLEHDLEDFKDRENDRYLLLKNDINKGIEHARQRFFDEFEKIDKRINTLEVQLNHKESMKEIGEHLKRIELSLEHKE